MKEKFFCKKERQNRTMLVHCGLFLQSNECLEENKVDREASERDFSSVLSSQFAQPDLSPSPDAQM